MPSTPPTPPAEKGREPSAASIEAASGIIHVSIDHAADDRERIVRYLRRQHARTIATLRALPGDRVTSRSMTWMGLAGEIQDALTALGVDLAREAEERIAEEADRARLSGGGR